MKSGSLQFKKDPQLFPLSSEGKETVEYSIQPQVTIHDPQRSASKTERDREREREREREYES